MVYTLVCVCIWFIPFCSYPNAHRLGFICWHGNRDCEILQADPWGLSSVWSKVLVSGNETLCYGHMSRDVFRLRTHLSQYKGLHSHANRFVEKIVETMLKLFNEGACVT